MWVYLEQKLMKPQLPHYNCLRKEVDHIQFDMDQCFYSILQDDLILVPF